MAFTITFFGPDATSKVIAANAAGVEVANFTIENDSRSDFKILRLVNSRTAPIPICKGHKSSLSGTTAMNVHGQEIKYKAATSGMGLTIYVLETPIGKFTWRTEKSSTKAMRLEDEAKQVVAYGNLKEMKFSVLVPGDEVLLDTLLAGWVTLVRAKKASAEGAETAEAVATAFDAMGTLASAVGGGGA